MDIRVASLEDEISFKCFDEDLITSQTIGEGQIKISEIDSLPASDTRMWVTIYCKGYLYGQDPAGKILFYFLYLPEKNCEYA